VSSEACMRRWSACARWFCDLCFYNQVSRRKNSKRGWDVRGRKSKRARPSSLPPCPCARACSPV
jgi:hypothetical protein